MDEKNADEQQVSFYHACFECFVVNEKIIFSIKGTTQKLNLTSGFGASANIWRYLDERILKDDIVTDYCLIFNLINVTFVWIQPWT